METARVLHADATAVHQPRRPQRILARLAGLTRRWRAAERARRELGNMSDFELTDIGLTRSDIAAVAGGRYRR